MLKASDYHYNQIHPEFLSPYVQYVVANSEVRYIRLDKIQQRRYTGDFFGLLLELGILSNLWLLQLVVNGYTSPSDYAGDEAIKTISGREFNELMTAHAIVQKR